MSSPEISIAGPDQRREELSRRAVGAVITVATAAVLLVAAYLDPDPAGVGTHEQLGLTPCGWMLAADMPCPTCGMTTAFAHAAEGNLLQSLRTQPLGACLALATAMACLVGAFVATTGSRIGLMYRRLWTRRFIWILGTSVVVAWVYKIIDHRVGFESLF
ncbi:MAG: DUF2752 domain-containing protein [Planctomycetota bacterium]